jgi:nicotinamide-nucleotide adenylyltransferase
MRTALFIGRFQPFHLGHLSVVKRAIAECDHLLIGIGSAEDSYLPENPFTAGERWEMVRAALEEANIPRDRYSILPVRNIDNYALWVNHVEQLLPPFGNVYTGSSIVKKLFEDHGKHAVVDVEFELEISGTEVRKKMKRKEGWEACVPKTVQRYLEKNNRWKRLQDL